MWWGKSNWRYSPDINVWEGKESHMNRTGDIFIGAGGAQFGFQKSSHLQPLASGCKWLQVAGCGWLWLVVAGCGWLWLVVAGCGWLWLVVAGCGCVASGCKWLLVAACGWKWLLGQVTASGCKWLQVAANGYVAACPSSYFPSKSQNLKKQWFWICHFFFKIWMRELRNDGILRDNS